MKVSLRLLALILLLCVAISSFAGCDVLSSLTGGGDTTTGDNNNTPTAEHIDYVGQTKLDMNSNTLKLEVTLKYHIDGDTTHFNVPRDVESSGVMKARYLAVNTPESTGKVEEWGKTASNFTKEKLTNAKSIIVESESDRWNYDGNGRFLVWVWYMPEDGTEYRNLNLELLQSGLAVGSKAGGTRYGDAAVSAIAQATSEKLYIFSDDIDPLFPYGAAQSVTLKELRTNITEYEGAKVSFEGVITFNSDYTAYIEEYDPETDMYYGIQIFYGYISSLISPLAQGNRVRIVGVVGSFHGTYQVSGLDYNPMKPNDPANTAVISKGNEVAFKEVSAEKYYSKINVEIGEEIQQIDFTKLALSTSLSMNNLVVTKVYTTTNPSASDTGAMTLTCTVDGKTIDVRTAVLKDANGNIVTAEYFQGATIDVKGILDYYDYNDSGNGTYQIKVYSLSDIVKH